MRNLKRVLSLALASAMLLGMMVMGAGAADTKKPLTDLDKVVNKDAVNLMVDLAVITGKPDGSFAPAETVDRATMSTLIYKIMTGETNADSFKGTSNLKDVTGTWAEGFINYCSSLKIVSGDGTNFYPTNKVTVVQAAKMLLVAIGYDAELSKYQNDANWSINIMRDAKKAGILDEIGQKATDELTRDNAAQMVNNTLFAKIVSAQTGRDQGEAYLIKYEPTGSTLAEDTYSLVKISGTVSDVKDGKASFTSVTPDNANKILAAVNKAGITAGADVKGKNVTMYVKGSVSYNTDGSVKSVTVDKVYSTVLSAGASNVLATVTDGTTLAKLTTPSGTEGYDKAKFVAVLADDPTFAINGDDEKSEAQAKTAMDGKKGVIVELIDVSGKGEIDLVKITAKEAKEVTGAVETRTYKDEFQVKVPGVVSTFVAAEKVNGYEDLVKGDYVLVYTDTDSNYYLELAETMTGKITGKKSTNEIRVDGTYYGWSGLANSHTIANVTVDEKLNTKDEYTFILDNNGTITKTVNNTKEATAETAVVLDTAWVSGGGIGASKYLEVKLLKTDGTTEIVTVIDVDGTTPTATTSTHPTQYEFYKYTVDNKGKYTLTHADAVDIGETKIENGKTGVGGVATANAKTVYLVQKGTDDNIEYFAYTGYASVPTMNIADDTDSKVVKDGSIAKYVFLTADKFIGDSESLNYVYIPTPKAYSTDTDADGNTLYIYDAIIEGAVETITVDGMLPNDFTAGLYNVSLTDGVASKTELVKPENKIALKAFVSSGDNKDSIADGVVMVASLGSGKVYTYDADTIITVIELTMKNGAVSAADVVNATTGNDFKFTPEDGYTYQVVVAPAKEGGELLSALYIFQTVAP